MSRLIDPIALKQSLAVSAMLEDGRHIFDIIDAQPTIEERKKGKWIYHSDWEADGECCYECSECGMGSDVDYSYCMRCGADMRGGEDDEAD